ncbi:hypothetical protein L2K20_25515 [Mycobacterium sp. MBM]|nr:hypothetical protein [Mycobacterium sp. MBM]
MASRWDRNLTWRDPLSLSFEVHRRVLLARLRRHQRRQAASAPPSRLS